MLILFSIQPTPQAPGGEVDEATFLAGPQQEPEWTWTTAFDQVFVSRKNTSPRFAFSTQCGDVLMGRVQEQPQYNFNVFASNQFIGTDDFPPINIQFFRSTEPLLSVSASIAGIFQPEYRFFALNTFTTLVGSRQNPNNQPSMAFRTRA